MEASRRRYEVLDALRGLCALAVVALHFCEAYHRGRLLPHAHLAVEYFFMLTGFTFVIAYDARWRAGTLTVANFLWRRFVRLWPLILIGSFVGLLICFGLPGQFYGGTPKTVLGQLGRYGYALTMLPQPESMGMITAYQPQTWTLLYIIYANLLYALLLRFIPKPARWALLAAAAGYTVWATMRFKVLAFGWVWNGTHVTAASARMAFPLLLGLCLGGTRWCCAFRGAGLVAALLLGWALFAPTCGVPPAAGWYELACVFAGLPLVLLCGAGGSIPEGRFAAFCRFMGRYSFPLYATHYPFTTILRTWLAQHPDLPASTQAAFIFALLAAIAFVAYLALRGADWIQRATLTRASVSGDRKRPN